MKLTDCGNGQEKSNTDWLIGSGSSTLPASSTQHIILLWLKRYLQIMLLLWPEKTICTGKTNSFFVSSNHLVIAASGSHYQQSHAKINQLGLHFSSHTDCSIFDLLSLTLAATLNQTLCWNWDKLSHLLSLALITWLLHQILEMFWTIVSL